MVNRSDSSDRPDRLERLYSILEDAEALLQGTPGSAPGRTARETLAARVESVIARGWDSPLPDADGKTDDASGYGGASATDRPVPRERSSLPDGPTPPGDPAADPLSAAAARYLAMTPDERSLRLEEIARAVLVCNACPLSMGRTNAVPGEGPLDPLVMIIGEGPGYNEDQEGRPFVGPAGQYLDKWLDAIGLVRGSNVWIGNVVKCRPPENRDPRPEESDACIPYLREQIALVRPRLIMTVGRISMRLLTGTTQGITRVHGSFYRYEGIPLVPTFHPSAVLRNPDYRRPVWEDLKKVRNWLIDNAGLDPGDGQE
jgi:uracil-DNA glycosylase family 4